MNKIIASAAFALAIAAGATTASADRYGYGYNSRPSSASEAFARQAARDGRISRDEARIINNLRAREAHAPTHHYRPWYRRWW